MPTPKLQSAIHSGNYYSLGAVRVIAKLTEMGIAFPQEVLEFPKFEGGDKPFVEFTRIEHALLDWFDGRDYDQAQALIHFRPPVSNYHIIRILNEELCPPEISHDMLCPTRADAVAAVVFACDHDATAVEAFRKQGDYIVAVINGADALRIEAITYEPFDIAARDRVRTSLKGVRERDRGGLRERAARLPGFAGLDYGADLAHRKSHWQDRCLLLGYPANWALAMRGALKQVDIIVKQSQAQELAASFFGANSWHQLIKHQNELNDGLIPIAVKMDTANGVKQSFYWTNEEALFAVGICLRSYQEPVVVKHFSLTFDKTKLMFSAATQKAAAVFTEVENCPPCIECGSNDYWSAGYCGEHAHLEAAQKVLQALDTEDSTILTNGILYSSSGTLGILASVLEREGQPSTHAVEFDEHGIAVFHMPNPDGGPSLAAYALIYQINEGRLSKVHEVAMYKAEVDVVNKEGKTFLVIEPDYGNSAPIDIPFSDMAQVDRLMELSYGGGLFSLTVPYMWNEERRTKN